MPITLQPLADANEPITQELPKLEELYAQQIEALDNNCFTKADEIEAQIRQRGELKEFIQVEYFIGDQSQGSYISEIGKLEMEDECEHLAVGDSFKLTKIEMTQEEKDNLPEFQGF